MPLPGRAEQRELAVQVEREQHQPAVVQQAAAWQVLDLLEVGPCHPPPGPAEPDPDPVRVRHQQRHPGVEEGEHVAPGQGREAQAEDPVEEAAGR